MAALIIGRVGLSLPVIAIFGGAAVIVIGSFAREIRRLNRQRRQRAKRHHPVVRTPARFYTGPMPTYEDCPLLPAEEQQFEWITKALKASARGRNGG